MRIVTRAPWLATMTVATLSVVAACGGELDPDEWEEIPYRDPAAASPCAPQIDSGHVVALHVYEDCDGTWRIRGTAGGDRASHAGVITSDKKMQVQASQLEAGDVLDTSNPRRVTFKLNVSKVWTDGIDIVLAAGAKATLTLEKGGPLLAGKSAQQVSSPFTLESGAAPPPGTAPPPGGAPEDGKPPYCGVWGIWSPPTFDTSSNKWFKGSINTFSWNQIEPSDNTFDWSTFDKKLKTAHDNGHYIMFMVYHGGSTPEWVYARGVPKVKTKEGNTFPYYLHPAYVPLLKRMIKNVAQHVNSSYSVEMRKKILAVQFPCGTSGDGGPYRTTPVDSKYVISDKDWESYTKDLITYYHQQYKQYNSISRPMVSLINVPPDLDPWVEENFRPYWVKSGGASHMYQCNGELDGSNQVSPLVKSFRPDGTAVRSRGENEWIQKTAFYQVAPLWNVYWLQLYNLHVRQDFHMLTADTYETAKYHDSFKFFSKYAGYKDARDSLGAFCALRDGLDASDGARFPAAKYGAVIRDNKQRYEKILAEFAADGAKMADWTKFADMNIAYRGIKGINDVGWRIVADNYEMFLSQHDPNGTSKGVWQVGSKDQMFGRFGRRFDHASGRDTMYFKIDDNFFFGKPLGGAYPITIRVVYLDEGNGTWQLKYDAVGDPQKTAYTLKKGDTGLWKEKVITVSDGYFGHRCPNHTDILLANSDAQDDLFHMVEVTRSQGNRTGQWGEGQ